MFTFTLRNCWKWAALGNVLRGSGGFPCDYSSPENTWPAIKLSFCLQVWGWQRLGSGAQIHRRGPRKKGEWRNWEFWTKRGKMPNHWLCELRNEDVGAGHLQARFPHIPAAPVQRWSECGGPRVQVGCFYKVHISMHSFKPENTSLGLLQVPN